MVSQFVCTPILRLFLIRVILNRLISPGDIRIPASLAFHICDIYLEELDKALSATSPSPIPLSVILLPFFNLAALTQANTTYKQIQSTIFDPLFTALKTPRPNSEEPSSRKRPRLEQASYPNLVLNACVSDSKGGPVDGAKIRKALLRQMFDIASEERTRDSNRRKMYAMFKAAKEDEGESDSESDN